MPLLLALFLGVALQGVTDDTILIGMEGEAKLFLRRRREPGDAARAAST